MPIFTRASDLSEVDPAKILEDSYRNESPFGVPTIVLKPEEFEEFSEKAGRFRKFSRTDMQDHIKARLAELFNRQSDMSQEQKDYITERYVEEAFEVVMMQIVSNLVIPQYVQSGCVTYPFRGIKGPFAHQSSQNDFENPVSGMVFTFTESIDGRTYGESAMSLAENELPEMPGSSEEWHFLLLWHEFAHTTGAAEPQADKMAAIVTRQAFARSDVIQAFADQRMVTAILNHHRDTSVSYYGLPLVENLDEVAAMPQEQIDAMDEEDIKDIRFNKHDYKADKVRAVGGRLKCAFPDIFETIRKKTQPIAMKDLIDLKQETERLVAEGTFQDDPDTCSIARRFVLAVTRLSEGKGAYTAPALKL